MNFLDQVDFSPINLRRLSSALSCCNTLQAGTMGHSPSPPPPPIARRNGEDPAIEIAAEGTHEESGIASTEATPQQIEEGAASAADSIWSSFISSTLGVFDARAGTKGKDKGNALTGPMQWTAAVKRAVGSSPVRRLQECIMGVRGANGLAPGTTIWLLGVCYRMPSGSEDESTSPQVFPDFIHDFSSRIWITYRRGFEAIGQSKLTSDVGWGCMIRSGQMLFAQALVCHYLGRTWRREDKPYAREYLEILQSFGDSPAPACPFSIHNFINAGSPYGLSAGSWIGPYALCHAIEALADRERSRNMGCSRALPMAVYVVSGDAEGERGGAPVLCIDDVAGICSSWDHASVEWGPVLILVPLVLGLDKVNPRYLPSLRTTFTFPQSLGIAGGKPGASTYLVGVQDDQALYLDPHEVQKVVSISADVADADTSSYHCSVVRRMPLDAIDPSLALGFYCRNREEFNDLCARASDLASQSNGAPMFTVAQGVGRWKLRGQNSGTAADTAKAGDDDVSLANVNLGSDALSEEDWQIL